MLSTRSSIINSCSKLFSRTSAPSSCSDSVSSSSGKVGLVELGPASSVWVLLLAIAGSGLETIFAGRAASGVEGCDGANFCFFGTELKKEEILDWSTSLFAMIVEGESSKFSLALDKTVFHRIHQFVIWIIIICIDGLL